MAPGSGKRRTRRLVERSSASLLLLLLLNLVEASLTTAHRARVQGPSADFRAHKIVRPRFYHSRSKREIISTRESDTDHTDILSLGLELNGVNQILDLRLNRDLIPIGYKERYQHQGAFKTHVPSKVELCHYQGSIRNVPGSWVALSTCTGLKGVIFDGESLHHIQPEEESLQSIHYVYKHSDVLVNNTCGYTGNPHHVMEEFNMFNKFNKISRHKRATETIRGPYNANRQSRYVELVLVIDKNEYTSLEQNLTRVHHHCKDIANIINALYAPLNIFIALVGVEVWTDADEIHLLSSGDKTLVNFLQYRKERLVKSIPNDNAQLLTKMQFDDGVVGKALKGPICTYEFSGGVSVDHSNVVGLVAATVAHEMGHNFGMEHDSNECLCPEERCIMAPSSGSSGPTHWSSCSLEYLALAFEHGMDYCLRNKPKQLFDSPICGNGFVEPGEQCDCGLVDNCDNPCCNASSCMLHGNASCATGECCDLSICKPKAAGTECRSAEQECDLPEYCTGQSEYCPTDVFKIDGEACSMGKAYCYQGNCRTHNDQCKLLWGPTGSSSDSLCYEMNDKGTKTGNCGFNRTGNNYVKCQDKNILCGMLHCKHLNERLEFGMESVAILSHSFLNSQGNIIACRSAMVDLGLNQVDPGLAPDGARCAQGKMCVNQKCIAVDELRTSFPSGRACPNDCGGNGVCNSLGHCHCNRGFQPPDCTQPGVGGSEDSGPAEDPNARSEYIMSLYIIFLGIVPTISLVSFGVWYARNNGGSMKQWKKASGSSGPLSTLSRGFGFGGPVLAQQQQRPRPFNPGEAVHPPTVKTIERPDATNRGIDSIDSSLATAHQDPACASLLPKIDPDERFNNNFFGQFKGFSISPLAQPGSKPSLPEPPPWGLDEATTVAIKTNPGLSRRGLAPGGPPALPPPNVGSSARPLISSPVLAATTCTSVELPAPCVPTRPAPDVPSDVPLPKPSGSRGSALIRIASILYPSSGPVKSIGQVADIAGHFGGNSTLPRSHRHKTSKSIDREILRSLEISHPILQKEIEIPGVTISVKPEPESGPERRAALARAQSLRDSKVTPRPAIHTFGSMRQPHGVQRPTSVPASVRPTSPPPIPPVKSVKAESEKPKKSGVDDAYDDCMNLVMDPSLSKIVEESPSNDNIYAVIEESVPEKFGSKRTEPVDNEYKTPKSIEATAPDSMGLLSEIVSEISNRNFDSIYSTRTLGSEPQQTDSKRTSDNGVYANSPGSLYSNSSMNSDYLHSSVVNVSANKILNKLPEKKKETISARTKTSVSLGKSQKPTRSETLFKDTNDAKLNSPDVVSSCSSNISQTNKSPDVLGRDNKAKGSTKISTLSRQKSLAVPPKPSDLLCKASSFSDKNKAMSTISSSKSNMPTQVKVVTTMTRIITMAATTTTATTTTTTMTPTTVTAITMSTTSPKLESKSIGSAMQIATSGKSNVASLQQKFEQSEKNETTALTRKKSHTAVTFNATVKK